MEARLAGEEEAKDDKGGKGGKKEAPKAAPKGKGGKDVVPDGTVCKVTQYEISPAVGSVTPG